MKTFNYDILIVGAGASGMMAAHFCSLGGKSIGLLDHNNQVGRKILISGGGKCNFTNKYGESTDYHSNNPHFVKSALSRYTGWDFIDLIEKYNIPYEERKWGQLFCKKSAKDINSVLLSLIKKSNISLKLGVKNLKVEKVDGIYKVFNDDETHYSKNLIIATGGLVLPSIGASSFGHIIAKSFGHKIIPTSPALVPFIVDGFNELRGNAFVAGISCNGHYVAENVLFTHKGLSGPAILKTSLFWNPGDSFKVNWLPEHKLSEIYKTGKQKVQINTPLKKYLPKAFVEFFFDRIGINSSTYIEKLSSKDLKKIETELHSMIITPSGTEGFRKAEVTRGGIDTTYVSSKTMESKLSPGLYFTGEVLDVTGQLGGHNFQWCWSSAFAVGQALK